MKKKITCTSDWIRSLNFIHHWNNIHYQYLHPRTGMTHWAFIVVTIVFFLLFFFVFFLNTLLFFVKHQIKCRENIPQLRTETSKVNYGSCAHSIEKGTCIYIFRMRHRHFVCWMGSSVFPDNQLRSPTFPYIFQLWSTSIIIPESKADSLHKNIQIAAALATLFSKSLILCYFPHKFLQIIAEEDPPQREDASEA